MASEASSSEMRVMAAGQPEPGEHQAGAKYDAGLRHTLTIHNGLLSNSEDPMMCNQGENSELQSEVALGVPSVQQMYSSAQDLEVGPGGVSEVPENTSEEMHVESHVGMLPQAYSIYGLRGAPGSVSALECIGLPGGEPRITPEEMQVRPEMDKMPHAYGICGAKGAPGGEATNMFVHVGPSGPRVTSGAMLDKLAPPGVRLKTYGIPVSLDTLAPGQELETYGFPGSVGVPSDMQAREVLSMRPSGPIICSNILPDDVNSSSFVDVSRSVNVNSGVPTNVLRNVQSGGLRVDSDVMPGVSASGAIRKTPGIQGSVDKPTRLSTNTSSMIRPGGPKGSSDVDGTSDKAQSVQIPANIPGVSSTKSRNFVKNDLSPSAVYEAKAGSRLYRSMDQEAVRISEQRLGHDSHMISQGQGSYYRPGHSDRFRNLRPQEDRSNRACPLQGEIHHINAEGYRDRDRHEYYSSSAASQQPQQNAQHHQGSSKPNILPEKFSGETSWDDYMVHFQMCAEINGWSQAQKASFLAVSLRGPAQQVLGDLGTAFRYDFDSLSKALARRFGSEGQTELFRVQLKGRMKKTGESYPELAQAIRRLITRAYPHAPLSLQETLAKDYFIDALVDSEMRLRIQQAKPQTLDQAVVEAIELEAFERAERQRFQTSNKRTVRSTRIVPDNPQSTENDLLVLVKEMAAELKNLKGQVSTMARSNMRDHKFDVVERGQQDRFAKMSRPPRREFTCFGCGEKGHVVANCPLSRNVDQAKLGN